MFEDFHLPLPGSINKRRSEEAALPVAATGDLRHHLANNSSGTSWKSRHRELHHDVQSVRGRAAGDQKQTSFGVIGKGREEAAWIIIMFVLTTDVFIKST